MSIWLDIITVNGELSKITETLDVINHRIATHRVSFEAEANLLAALMLIRSARKHVFEAADALPETTPAALPGAFQQAAE